jgi:hypothetical protein
MLPPDSLKYRAIREALLWEDDAHAYRRFLNFIRARRVANLLKARERGERRRLW